MHRKEIELCSGQMSIWNIPAKAPEKIEKIEEHSDTKTEPLLTQEQAKIYERYMSVTNVRRVVKRSGYLAIEVQTNDEIKTHYIKADGMEDFSVDKETAVLPGDKIIYHSNFEIENTKIQNDKLQQLLCSSRDKIKRVIKRKGDFNILVEMQDKVIDILPNGWALDFETIKSIDCTKDEIFIIPEKIESKEPVMNESNLKTMQQSIKVGDFVESEYFGENNSRRNSSCLRSCRYNPEHKMV